MKAFVLDRYSSPDRLVLSEVRQPHVADNEVLIQVRATSVNAFDWRHIRAKPFLYRFSGAGFFKPKHRIPGVDVAGVVEAVGKSVKFVQPGDFVCTDVSGCGLGGFAEFVCADESVVAAIPDDIGFDTAASIPMAGVAALQGLRDFGEIKSGMSVAIVGASGGVGSFAVQIAKSFDTVVTGVCDTQNLETVSSLGADHVIDYTTNNFTQLKQRYDLIFGVSGYYPLLSYKRALTNYGIYVMCGGTTSQILQATLLGPFLSMGSSRKIKSFNAIPNTADLESVIRLVGSHQIKPLIDRSYVFEQIPEAIRYLEHGSATGKVVISMAAER